MKNKVEWQDIVKVNGEYYLEMFDVEFEDERLNNIIFGNDMILILDKLEELKHELDDFDYDCLYDCSDFFASVREKYDLDEDEEVETYLFDYIDLPDEVTEKYDIAWLGGYINGVNI